MKKTPPHRPFLRLVGSEPEEHSHTGLWRDGDSFIVTPGAMLPDRCVKCGEPAGGWTRKKTLYWHSPLWFALVPLFFGLVYLVVASVVKKSSIVHVPLCAHHQRQYSRATKMAALMIPAFPILLIAGIIEVQPPLLIAGIVFSLGGLALMLWARNPIWATQINEEGTRVRGAHSSWLERLPPWRRAS